MTNLNKSLIDEIYSMLENNDLGLNNFDVRFPSSGKIIVEIFFKPQNEYQFKVMDVGGNPHRVSTEEIPGDFLKSEVKGGLSFSDIPGQVLTWADNVSAEIKALGKREDKFDDLAAQVNAFINEHVSDPESRFSQQEIAEIRTRLDELEKRFERLQQENQITENELIKLKGQVVKASEEVPILPKGIWYKLSLNRMFGTLKEIAKSKEGRELLKEAVKKLIGL